MNTTNQKKATRYTLVLNEVQKHQYRERPQLHKMMWVCGMEHSNTRNAMIRNLLDSNIIVEKWSIYEVVHNSIS